MGRVKAFGPATVAHLRHITWRPSRAGSNPLDQSSTAKIEERRSSINYFLEMNVAELIRKAAEALITVHHLEPYQAYELGTIAGRLLHVEELRTCSAILCARHLLYFFRKRRDRTGIAARKLLVFAARLCPRSGCGTAVENGNVVSLRDRSKRHEAPKLSLEMAAEEAQELGWPYQRYLRCAVRSWWHAG